MAHQYLTLSTLAEAVRDLPNPASYFCTPREMILRCNYDWATIFQHLVLLEEEKLVQLIDAENIQFAITNEGLLKAMTYRNYNSRKHGLPNEINLHCGCKNLLVSNCDQSFIFIHATFTGANFSQVLRT